MFARFAAVILVLALGAPAVRSETPSLQSLFTAAQNDPAGVVPLLESASRYIAALSPEESRKLGDTLKPVCRRAFFSPERLPGMERIGLAIHRVAKGDTPSSIAAHYGFAAKLLTYLNEGFDERRLRAGQELKVIDATSNSIEVEVDRALYRVRIWKRLASGARILVLHVPCGLGAADSPTPSGVTKITKRVLDPQWTDPDTKQVFAGNDPRNVLGGYWMALDAQGIARSGIGFHGFTGAPPADWIQRPASHGCVRMLQGDVDRLFHIALEGTQVTLR